MIVAILQHHAKANVVKVAVITVVIAVLVTIPVINHAAMAVGYNLGRGSSKPNYSSVPLPPLKGLSSLRR
jgi:hypothetical protein